jgi:hypothetical protein
MIKFIDLLLESKAPEIPEDVKKKIDYYAKFIFDSIHRLSPETLKELMEEFKKGYSFFIDEEAFIIKDFNGKEKKIGLLLCGEQKNKNFTGFYRHDENNIYIVYNPNITEDDIKVMLNHELIHAMDPKGEKLTTASMEKAHKDELAYYKSLHEFDAYSRNIIDMIEKNINKKDVSARFKIYTSKQFIKFLSELNVMGDFFKGDIKKRIDEFYKKHDMLCEKYEDDLSWLFDKKDVFEHYVLIMMAWATKPTLFKRFMQRVAHVLQTKTPTNA